VPVSWFQFEDLEDPDCVLCWQIANLRPSWPADNRAKMDRFAFVGGVLYTRETWIVAGRPMPRADEMISQKTALELYESEALAIANKF
jgi:hypothetical protein